MMDEVRWKPIGIKGLKRYEISNTGLIRVIATKARIPVALNDNGFKSAMLQYYGNLKMYHIHILLFDTFRIVSQEHPISKAQTSEAKKSFSSDEYDYGKGAHKHDWRILKEEIEAVERQRLKTGQNEKRDESNLD